MYKSRIPRIDPEWARTTREGQGSLPWRLASYTHRLRIRPLHPCFSVIAQVGFQTRVLQERTLDENHLIKIFLCSVLIAGGGGTTDSSVKSNTLYAELCHPVWPWASHMRAPFSLILRARGMPATCLPHGGFGGINETMSELCFRLLGDSTIDQELLAQARTISCPFLTSLSYPMLYYVCYKVLAQRSCRLGRS